ncbi:MAG: GAF domain-containing protein [Gammaproteobacteria bacterium]|nr:GAF domain-containing protein [Gammaproteobacteria bacterium]
MLSPHSVRVRLLLLVSVAAVPLVALTIYNAVEVRANAVRDTQSDLLTVVKLAGDDLQNRVSAAEQLIVSLSQAPSVHKPNPVVCNRLLSALLKEYQTYSNLFVANAKGDILCSGSPLTKTINVVDREYFRAALHSARPVVGKPTIGRVVGQAVLPVAYALTNARGQPTGVVGASINLNSFARRILDKQLGPDAIFTIREHDGTVVVRAPEIDNVAGNATAPSPITPLLQNANGPATAESIGIDGINRLYAFLPMFHNGTGLWLVASVGKDALLLPHDRMFTQAMGALLLIVLLAGAGAWTWGDFAIRRPVTRLLKATRRICRLDYTARIHGPPLAGELGELARSFDEMAEALEQHANEAQRTREQLARRNRALKTLSECNQALVRAETEAELLHSVSRLIIEHGGYVMSWIGLSSPESSVRIVAHAGFENAGISAVSAAQHGHTMAIDALHTRRQVIDHRLAHDPLFAGAKPRPPTAAITLPVNAGDETLGVLVIYTNEPSTFGTEEMQLLAELAADLGYGITNLRIRSARTQALEEIQRLNSELERRVQERTAQLEASNKDLESFSYSVSHDLRAPLRVIDGFSSILAEDYTAKLDDEGRRVIGIIRRNSGKMGQLIDDLLLFSRLGRNPINTSEVDMRTIVDEVLADLQVQIAGPTPAIQINTILPVHGDRALLQQVWINLLSNAVKFSAGATEPTVTIASYPEGNEHIYYVRDNGAGFDMRYYQKLFNVFQRLHGSDDFPGTGVGLAIVQRVIARHGGRVWAHGETNAGATFYFSLPN